MSSNASVTYGDSSTDNWQGCFGNKLNLSSCALTASAEADLANALPPQHPARMIDEHQNIVPSRLREHALLKISYPDSRIVLYRTFDDRAPEADPRLDIFNPWAFNQAIPDIGNVEVVS